MSHPSIHARHRVHRCYGCQHQRHFALLPPSYLPHPAWYCWPSTPADHHHTPAGWCARHSVCLPDNLRRQRTLCPRAPHVLEVSSRYTYIAALHSQQRDVVVVHATIMKESSMKPVQEQTHPSSLCTHSLHTNAVWVRKKQLRDYLAWMQSVMHWEALSKQTGIIHWGTQNDAYLTLRPPFLLHAIHTLACIHSWNFRQNISVVWEHQPNTGTAGWNEAWVGFAW